MNKRLKTIVAAASLVMLGSAAIAALRVPQVPVLGGNLQAYLNGQGESINVLTDQEDAQVFQTSASGNALLTIKVQFSPNAAAHIYGIYNGSAAVPALYVAMSGAVGPLGFSTLSFKPGNMLVINRFDANGNFLSSTTYAGVDANNFGFYISGPGGTYFSQDYRNPGGAAQMLAYKGTGLNAGEWWLCFEESNVAAGADQDYDDAVLILESVNPLATEKATLGSIKALYRK